MIQNTLDLVRAAAEPGVDTQQAAWVRVTNLLRTKHKYDFRDPKIDTVVSASIDTLAGAVTLVITFSNEGLHFRTTFAPENQPELRFFVVGDGYVRGRHFSAEIEYADLKLQPNWSEKEVLWCFYRCAREMMLGSLTKHTAERAAKHAQSVHVVKHTQAAAEPQKQKAIGLRAIMHELWSRQRTLQFHAAGTRWFIRMTNPFELKVTKANQTGRYMAWCFETKVDPVSAGDMVAVLVRSPGHSKNVIYDRDIVDEAGLLKQVVTRSVKDWSPANTQEV